MRHLILTLLVALSAAASPMVIGQAELDAWTPDEWLNQTIRFEVPLTVCDTYNWEKYGEIILSLDGRLYSDGNWKSGSSFASRATARLITLSDGSTAENPRPLPFLAWGRALRVGDRLLMLEGRLTKGEYGYELVPAEGPPVIETASRPPALSDHPELRVASFNLLNYFATLDKRGADSEFELARQQAKLLVAIEGLNPDLLAMIEVENDKGAAVNRLLDALNTYERSLGKKGDWTLVTRPGDLGDDAIRVDMAYRKGRLRQQGPSIASPDPIHSRPPLGATFSSIQDGEVFSVIVSHFKSKGCRGAEGVEADQGQGCWNAKRTRQARSLLLLADSLKAISQDPDLLLVGDFNACAGEDPALEIQRGGYVQLLDRLEDADRYSYVYKGEACALDHAYVSPELDLKVLRSGIWHINCDEPRLLDYNMERRDPLIYTEDPYRSSDHDPVWVDIRKAETSAPAGGATK
jgi:predicted extracellular nuclease